MKIAMIGVAGLVAVKLDDLVRRIFKGSGAAREVIKDGGARYLDSLLDELSRAPESASIFGTIHFSEWMDQSAARAAMTNDSTDRRMDR